jgi:hypothetical protein
VTVVGSFRGVVDFNPGGAAVTLTSGANSAAFVAEYGGSFALQRVGKLEGSGGAVPGASAHGVAVDSAGVVWVAGEFQGLTTTGLGSLTSTGGNADVFVLRLQGNGSGYTTSLARSYGATGRDVAYAIAVDPAGNVYLGGGFQFAVNFDPLPNRSFTLTSGGDNDIFIVKLASDGNFQWARGIGGYRADLAQGLATDAQGNVFATGSFTDSVDFNPLDGSHVTSSDRQYGHAGFSSLRRLERSGGRPLWATSPGFSATVMGSPSTTPLAW